MTAVSESIIGITDHDGLPVLSFVDCRRLAGSQPAGRAAFVRDRAVEIFPADHCVAGPTVAFRTAVPRRRL